MELSQITCSNMEKDIVELKVIFKQRKENYFTNS